MNMNRPCDISEIKEKMTYYVLNAIRDEADPSDDRLREIIADVISDQASFYKLNLEQKREMASGVFNALRRLDVIEPLMEDPTITEIMVNGPDKIFYERGGKLYRSDIRFKDEETLRTVISCFFANRNRPQAPRRFESECGPLSHCQRDNHHDKEVHGNIPRHSKPYQTGLHKRGRREVPVFVR